MTKDDRHVRIEQRIDEPGRFLLFTPDDAIVFGIPMFFGWITTRLIEGAVLGAILLSLWRRLKGKGGLIRLQAALYWFLPQEVSPYRSFPPSDVEHWRG